MSLIFFDMEGPLTPQDNAYEIMGLWPGGRQVFEAISRYDDLLTLDHHPGYEPGDTLSLIVPFLLCHGLTTQAVQRMGETAPLIAGAREVVQELQRREWQVHAITTSYEPFARAIAGRLGIAQSNVACTALPLERLGHWFPEEDRRRTAQLEDTLASSPALDDASLRECLDHFYWHRPPHSFLRQIMRVVRPMGGSRKLVAVEAFCLAHGQGLHQVVAVGDSITDTAMLAAVDQVGGLAIAFNANAYALPAATAGLASTNIDDLRPLLTAWQAGGRPSALAWVQAQPTKPNGAERGDYRWLAGRPPAPEILALHQNLRRRLRQSAAALG